MRTVTIITFPQRSWSVAWIKIETTTGNCTMYECLRVNKFFKVTDDCILIYDTVGGEGTGYQPGQVLARINIIGADVRTREATEEERSKS